MPVASLRRRSGSATARSADGATVWNGALIVAGVFDTDLPYPVLIAPGINGSGPDHWQTSWERLLPGSVRTQPRSWTAPAREDWMRAFDVVSDALAGRPALVVAHSLGCPAAVLWAASRPGAAAGLFLVAPPDRAALNHNGVAEFAVAEGAHPGVPGVVAASADDPHCTTGAAQELATGWGPPLDRTRPARARQQRQRPR